MTASTRAEIGDVAVAWRVGSMPAVAHVNTAGRDELRAGTTVVICTYRRPQSLRRCLGSFMGTLGASDEVIVVDASDNADSERAVRECLEETPISAGVRYYRVDGKLRGLTRQRNFALDVAETEIVAFFDDDVVVSPGCLAAFDNGFRSSTDVVGIGALVTNECRPLDWQWRVRRLLGAVGDLRPGSYHRSGVSVPWTPVTPGSEPAAGDWLPGGASAWRTRAARSVRFDESLHGYAASEDLDFSVRMSRMGALRMHRDAFVEHFPDPRGRPEPAAFGYMEIRNRYRIHRRAFASRSAADVAWFVYAWTIDTLLLCRHFLIPSRWNMTTRQIGGRLRAALDLVRNPGAGLP